MKKSTMFLIPSFFFFFFHLHETSNPNPYSKKKDVPVVHLELGSKLQIAAIKEGDDVYMECNIRAHPWVTKVTWKHNVNIPSLALCPFP